MRWVVLLFGVLLFVPAALAETSTAAGNPSPFLRLFGRMHAMVVHFPIALILTAAVCDAGWRLRHRRKLSESSKSDTRLPADAMSPVAAAKSDLLEPPNVCPPSPHAKPGANAAGTCLMLGTVGAIVSAWFGWLNAGFEHAGSTESLLAWHRWLGVVTAGVAVVCLISRVAWRRGAANAGRVYGLGMALTGVIVFITGHLGGSLVYGEDYLFEVFGKQQGASIALAGSATSLDAGDAALKSPDHPATSAAGPLTSAPSTTFADSAGSVDFALEIQPVFAARCVECHGPEVKKADLRLDSLENALAAEAITPGDPEESELVERITLSPDHRRFMPKKSEPLAPQEIDAIRRWIAGLGTSAAPSPAGSPAGETPGGAGVAPHDGIGDQTAVRVAPSAATPSVDIAVRDAALAKLRDRGANAQPIAADSPAVEVDFSLLGQSVTDADLDLLAGLETSLERLNLGETAITNAGLEIVARFGELRRLRLQRTQISDAGIACLRSLTKLEQLNIYGTNVHKPALAELVAVNHNLTRVFAWGSAIGAEAAREVESSFPRLRIELGAPVPASQPAIPPAQASGTSNLGTKRPACCESARAAGKECDHPCCVDARAAGKVCSKCLAG